MQLITTEKKLLVLDELNKQKPALQAILRDTNTSPDRFIRLAVMCLRKNPELIVDIKGFIDGVLTSASLGLEPNTPRQHCFLIPYKDKNNIIHVQFQFGYKGLLELGHRAGIRTWIARAVREGDEFEYCYGTSQSLHHVPKSDTTPITHFYSYAILANGQESFEVMTKGQVDAIKARAPTQKVWNSDYEQMGKKTVCKRHSNYLPLSPKAVGAIALDNQVESGAIDIDVTDISENETTEDLSKKFLEEGNEPVKQKVIEQPKTTETKLTEWQEKMDSIPLQLYQKAQKDLKIVKPTSKLTDDECQALYNKSMNYVG